MRRILVENARRKNRVKHGGGWRRDPLDAVPTAVKEPADELLAVDELLEQLAAVDARAAEVVKLHFFAAMTLDEVAAALEPGDKTGIGGLGGLVQDDVLSCGRQDRFTEG